MEGWLLQLQSATEHVRDAAYSIRLLHEVLETPVPGILRSGLCRCRCLIPIQSPFKTLCKLPLGNVWFCNKSQRNTNWLRGSQEIKLNFSYHFTIFSRTRLSYIDTTHWYGGFFSDIDTWFTTLHIKHRNRESNILSSSYFFSGRERRRWPCLLGPPWGHAHAETRLQVHRLQWRM